MQVVGSALYILHPALQNPITPDGAGDVPVALVGLYQQTFQKRPVTPNGAGDVPVGVQVVGSAWCDEELLEVGSPQPRVPKGLESARY